MGCLDVGVLEIGGRQVCALKVGLPEGRASETGLGEVRALEISPKKIDLPLIPV